MAELNFPPSAEAARDQRPKEYEFGPQTTPYATDNGLTYTYDPDKNSWVLKKGQVVTQDDLELKLREKIDRTGGAIVGNESLLSFQDTPYNSTQRLVFRVDGRIFFNGQNKKLIFNDTTTNATAIYIDGEEEANKYIEFGTSGVVSHKVLVFSSTSEKTLIKHNHSEGDVTLIDCGTQTSFDESNIIKLSTNSKLSIREQSKEIVLIDTANSGRLKIKPTANNQKTFVVELGTHDTEILRVDADSHKIFTSQDYSDGLKSGALGAIVTGNENLVSYTEDNLVATVGFVKSGFFKPGMNVCAESEDAAEVGGLWTDGFNYYIKVEE